METPEEIDARAAAHAEAGIDLSKVKIRYRSDTDALRTARLLRINAEEAEQAAVIEARANGVTWTEIGLALGVTHQAARQRYKAIVDAALASA